MKVNGKLNPRNVNLYTCFIGFSIIVLLSKSFEVTCIMFRFLIWYVYDHMIVVVIC